MGLRAHLWGGGLTYGAGVTHGFTYGAGVTHGMGYGVGLCGPTPGDGAQWGLRRFCPLPPHMGCPTNQLTTHPTS